MKLSKNCFQVFIAVDIVPRGKKWPGLGLWRCRWGLGKVLVGVGGGVEQRAGQFASATKLCNGVRQFYQTFERLSQDTVSKTSVRARATDASRDIDEVCDAREKASDQPWEPRSF